MTTETKKFISDLGLSEENTATIQNNILQEGLSNVIRHKDGTITFDYLSNYHQINTFNNVDRKVVAVLDVIAGFRNKKNALNSLAFLAETGKPLTQDVEENQHNLTPKVDVPKVDSAPEIIAFLEQTNLMDAAKDICMDYINKHHAGMIMLDYFLINTANAFKKGDFVTGYDQVIGQSFHGIVIQADEKGMVQVFSSGDSFSLTSGMNAEVLSESQLTEDQAKELRELSIEHIESKIVEKDDMLTKYAKKHNKVLEAGKKAAAAIVKAAKDTKAREIRDVRVEKLLLMPIGTSKEIEAFKTVEKSILNMTVAQQDRVSRYERDAKVELINKLELKSPKDIKDAVEAVNNIENLTSIQSKQLSKRIKEAKATIAESKKDVKKPVEDVKAKNKPSKMLPKKKEKALTS